jgi:hypothetical protein
VLPRPVQPNATPSDPRPSSSAVDLIRSIGESLVRSHRPAASDDTDDEITGSGPIPTPPPT